MFVSKHALSALLCLLLPMTPASATMAGGGDLWTPRKVQETLQDWSQKYPQIFRIGTAQESFGVPRAGVAGDCPFDHGKGCMNHYFTIQDFVTHPEGSESSTYLPEVFWSGSMHGDEKLGPSVVMEAAAMLLGAATCEALPGPEPSITELGDATACREELQQLGMDSAHRQWLARLVATRRIVVVPSANSLGYYSNTKKEGEIDPARDFPYDENNCMRTAASRTINELFLEHMFQMAISFHTGEGVVGFPWRKGNEASPDKRSQLQVAKAFSSAVSGTYIYEEFRSPNNLFESSEVLHDYVTEEEEFDIMEHKGTFEDWAYAASWDYSVNTCNPSAFGGYSIEKTQYNDSTNRALAIYASITDTNNKDEEATTMKGNMRMALASADLVQPYVNIFGVNNLALTDDVIPMTDQASIACHSSKSLIASIRDNTMTLEWTVGGALFVDYTEVLYAKNHDDNIDCLIQPDADFPNHFNTSLTIDRPGGNGYFSDNGSDPSPNGSITRPSGDILGPVFKTSIDVSDFKAGDRITVLAVARVDQNWNFAHPEGDGTKSPQSHIVHARTNPDWDHEHNGKKIKGRLNWYSVPVKILFADYNDDLGTLELNNRFDQELHLGSPSDNEQEDSQKQPSEATPDTIEHDNEIEDEIENDIYNENENESENEVDNEIEIENEESRNESEPSMMARFWKFALTVGSVFSVFVFVVLRIQKLAELDKAQSLMHAEDEEEEGGIPTLRNHQSKFVDHPSDPYIPREDEIVEFNNEGIYNKKRTSGSPRRGHTSPRNSHLLQFVENSKTSVYHSESGSPRRGYTSPRNSHSVQFVEDSKTSVYHSESGSPRRGYTGPRNSLSVQFVEDSKTSLCDSEYGSECAGKVGEEVYDSEFGGGSDDEYEFDSDSDDDEKAKGYAPPEDFSEIRIV